MKHAVRVFRYEFSNLIRGRWPVLLAALLFVVTEVLFRFGGDTAKTVASLMNVVLIVIPLVAAVLGTIYMYNSREFNELLLAQPIDRTSIYTGKLVAFSSVLSLALVVGIGGPFLVHAYNLAAYAGKIIALLAVGICFVVIFTSLAFYAATRFEDRIRGLGLMILAWFFLTVLYDGLILLCVFIFQDYPYEPGLVAMVLANPIDLGRIFILMQLDISSLMGYTGAVFRKVFGSDNGTALSAAAMVVYTGVPVWLGLRMFRRKDF